MGINRKFKRRQLKEQNKKAKRALKNIVGRMNSLGDKCANCSRPFDREKTEDIDDWMVYVIDNQPNLICPECYQLIQEKKKEFEGEGDVEIN